MSLSMIVVLVCGFLLIALVLAMIFSRKFLLSLLKTDGTSEATFGNLTIRGQLVLALCLAFIFGMCFPLWLGRTDAQVDELTVRISELESNSSTDKQTIEELIGKNDSLNTELSDLGNRVEKLNGEISSLEGEVESLESDRGNLTIRVDKLKGELSSKEIIIQELRDKIGVLIAERDALRSHVVSICDDSSEARRCRNRTKHGGVIIDAREEGNALNFAKHLCNATKLRYHDHTVAPITHVVSCGHLLSVQDFHGGEFRGLKKPLCNQQFPTITSVSCGVF